MLEELRITSLGVIEESVLELGAGLTVITGETGAGKTMVVTALGLLLGSRADAAAVRSGARAARVEGLVRVRDDSGVRERVDEVGGEVEQDRVLLARSISAEGRSRAFVGGASVPAARLAALAEPLVAVHGQSDQHRLLTPSAQREALDRFAGPEALALREGYVDLHRALRAAERDLDELTATARERVRQADLLRLGLAEIEEVDPAPGEDADLSVEEARLGYADTLRTAAELARESLSADDGGPDALALTAAARGLLEGVREHDPEAAGLADRLAEVSYLLSDVAADVSSYASSLDTDPARLAAVSERRAALTRLTRKYGDDIAEVLAWAGEASRQLLDLDGTDDAISSLREERERLRGRLARAGAELSAVRGEAAARLAEVVTAELGALAMPHARLTVSVAQREDDSPDGLAVGDRTLRIGAHGLDQVEITLAANPGAPPRPLEKSASGGELSRVMLAVEVALAATTPVPTLVFDEVDAGVGGKAAVEVGRRLGLLARHAQVVVVTHLPQVAAFADRHYVVVKSSDGTVTTSGLSRLDDEGRVRELSRMLAGLEDSNTAMAHAQELLDTARGATPSTR
jgi:DNA repair protein RecN (Recombination protein N)